jgi:hypothetical protein
MSFYSQLQSRVALIIGKECTLVNIWQISKEPAYCWKSAFNISLLYAGTCSHERNSSQIKSNKLHKVAVVSSCRMKCFVVTTPPIQGFFPDFAHDTSVWIYSYIFILYYATVQSVSQKLRPLHWRILISPQQSGILFHWCLCSKCFHNWSDTYICTIRVLLEKYKVYAICVDTA